MATSPCITSSSPPPSIASIFATVIAPSAASDPSVAHTTFLNIRSYLRHTVGVESKEVSVAHRSRRYLRYIGGRGGPKLLTDPTDVKVGDLVDVTIEVFEVPLSSLLDKLISVDSTHDDCVTSRAVVNASHRAERQEIPGPGGGMAGRFHLN